MLIIDFINLIYDDSSYTSVAPFIQNIFIYIYLLFFYVHMYVYVCTYVCKFIGPLFTYSKKIKMIKPKTPLFWWFPEGLEKLYIYTCFISYTILSMFKLLILHIIQISTYIYLYVCICLSILATIQLSRYTSVKDNIFFNKNSNIYKK